ncbi:porin [Lysobacteraceae bacterium NML03-0222]|nr:porin [Xanthomonadaceae bacterium NML03-0222]
MPYCWTIRFKRALHDRRHQSLAFERLVSNSIACRGEHLHGIILMMLRVRAIDCHQFITQMSQAIAHSSTPTGAPMRVSLLSLSLILAAGISQPLAAQSVSEAELAELKQQLATLQARIQALEAQAADAKPTASTTAANSPQVSTQGGVKVSTAEKDFKFSLSGRMHWDAYAFDRDIAPVTGTSELRRARLILQGKAYGWEYKLEQDFAAGSNLDGLRDAYIATQVGPGKLTIGQFKPYRSMDELTSSNELLMTERAYASATGVFNGRQFQQGVGYLIGGEDYTLGASVFNLRNTASSRNEGLGVAARTTWAPLRSDDTTVHLGLSLSHENSNHKTPGLSARANYAGRRGPSLTIATTPEGSGQSVNVVGLEAAAAMGSAFVQAEYMQARYGQPMGRDQRVDAWYVQGSWLLNGGHKPYKAEAGVFGSAKVESGGQWELVARHDQIRNRDLADRQARSTTFGVNYYANPALRFMLNYTRGDNQLNGDNTGQYALRTQFVF